jgi:hypothetical protein
MLTAMLLTAAILPGGSPWREGTILLLEDSNLVVSTVTDSRITHVAMIFNDDDRPQVYEATPGQVRRVPLPDYLTEIARQNERRAQPIRVYVSRPVKRFTDEQAEEMRAHVRRELGRRYSVKSYVRDRAADGLHCSEFAARTLNRSARYAFRDCHRITPGGLAAALAEGPFPYRQPVKLSVPEQNITLCEKTADCWDGFWNWCGWACVESWMFCR